MDQTTITDGSITIGTATPSVTPPQNGASQTSGVVTGNAQAAGQTAAAAQSTGQATTGTQTSAASTADPVGLFEKFDIPDMVKKTYPDLVPLVLETESMNDDERQYWFQILPIMTEDQVKKLREILSNEKNQLAEIDKQYNREVKQINEQHVTEWKEFERKDKRENLIEKEKKTEEEEAKEQEALLGQLNNI